MPDIDEGWDLIRIDLKNQKYVLDNSTFVYVQFNENDYDRSGSILTLFKFDDDSKTSNTYNPKDVTLIAVPYSLFDISSGVKKCGFKFEYDKSFVVENNSCTLYLFSVKDSSSNYPTITVTMNVYLGRYS